MSVELAVIVRKLLDKIDLVIDIRENLYPGLYKRSNLFEIIVLCNRLFDIRFRHLIEFTGVHRL